MHSKVIIASLVCMLAASFNAGKGITNNVTKPTKQVEEIVDHAPNDDQAYFYIYGEDDYAGRQVYADFNHEEPITHFSLVRASNGVTANTTFSSTGSTVKINVPQTAGDHYATFRYRMSSSTAMKEKTIYIHSNGTYQYASSLSADDARGNFFIYHVASSEERIFLNYREEFNFQNSRSRLASNRTSKGQKNGLLTETENSIQQTAGSSVKDRIIIGKPIKPVFPIRPTYDLTKFDAEMHYANYVYANRGDAVVDAPYFTTNSLTTNNVNVTVNATWFDENNVEHPLRGIKVDLLTPENTSMDPNVTHFTNANGVYSTVIPYNIAKNYQREELQLRLSTVSRATYIESKNLLNYPICYSAKNTTNLLLAHTLSKCSSVTFNIRIYPGLSDRANAYEICQAQSLPYDYVNAFTSGVSTVRTEYPYEYSAYFNYRNYNRIVRIQQEDYKTWDLLNHEYSHYISDMLDLCEIPQNGVDYIHDVHENLIDKYGYYDGPIVAYREGLATYIGIASQLYFKSNNPNFSIPNVGDEIYQDVNRNLVVDYNEYSPASPRMGCWPMPVQGEAIESNVTSFLLKVLDNAPDRFGDCVALGHSAMWESITSNHSSYGYFNSICDLLDALVDLNPSASERIRMIANFEYIVDDNIIPKPVLKWTIMLYLCGGGGLEQYALDDVEEILDVGSKPWDVNIIIQAGGTTNWPSRFSNTSMGRYHVEGSRLVLDESLPLVSMGEESTFESFLNWGLAEYPAEKVGVVLWSHGGSITGICLDGNKKLQSSDAAQAFENAFQANGITNKLEFIGYDACGMQVQDVAEFNSQYFKYMVASEDDKPGEGWKYDEWIDDVYSKSDTEIILDAICDSYVDEHNYPISVLDLSMMGQYLTSFETLALSLKNNYPFSSIQGIANLARSSSYNKTTGCGTINGLSFLQILRSHNNLHDYVPDSQFEAAINAYNNLVKYNPARILGASGMTIYVCFTGPSNYPAEQTHFNNWRSIFC